MPIVFSPQAQKDLREARAYIARDNPVAARREVARIREAIKLLVSGNAEGREVVLQTGRRVRLWLVSSYRIYYRRQGRIVQIVRIYHQAREPIER